MAKRLISQSGYDKLQSELEHYVQVKRAEVAQKLKEARSFGDLSENAEYDEAKNEQAMVEARISELEYLIDNVEVVDEAKSPLDEVSLGSIVELSEDATGKHSKWHIVSSNEVSVREGKISDESPLGSALMRKKIGDNVILETPKGEKAYLILNISR